MEAPMTFICGYCRPDQRKTPKVKNDHKRRPRGMFSQFEDLIDHLMMFHRFKRNANNRLVRA
jgi:hypothetical protein